MTYHNIYIKSIKLFMKKFMKKGSRMHDKDNTYIFAMEAICVHSGSTIT